MLGWVQFKGLNFCKRLAAVALPLRTNKKRTDGQLSRCESHPFVRWFVHPCVTNRCCECLLNTRALIRTNANPHGIGSSAHTNETIKPVWESDVCGSHPLPCHVMPFVSISSKKKNSFVFCVHARNAFTITNAISIGSSSHRQPAPHVMELVWWAPTGLCPFSSITHVKMFQISKVRGQPDADGGRNQNNQSRVR